VPRSTPGNAYVTNFRDFYRTYSTPQCVPNYDTNAFWRCTQVDNLCDTSKCEKLTFAVAPSSSSNTAAAAAASAFLSHVQATTNNTMPTKLFSSAADLEAHVGQPQYFSDPAVKRIGVAVVFESGSPGWKYELRMNRTVNSGFQYLLPPTSLKTDVLLRSPWDFPKACDRW
jgi:hypothetical protein